MPINKTPLRIAVKPTTSGEDPRLTAIKDTVRKYAEQHEQARAETNAANKLKTIARNTLEQAYRTFDIKEGEFFIVDDYAVTVAQAEREIINVDKLLALYDKGKIKRHKLVMCLKVTKADAESHIGADLLIPITEAEKGDKADVRLKKIPEREGKLGIEISRVASAAVNRAKIAPTHVKPVKPEITSKTKVTLKRSTR